MALPALNILSLCSGGGGLEMAVQLVSPASHAVCHVEIDAYGAANLARLMDDGRIRPAPIWDDLRSFDGRPWGGVVDLVTAGYPCQPFSCAGKGLGERDPRHLWPDVRRVIEECEPGLCFLENVGAHLARGFETVERELRGLGFEVAAGLFSAAEVGAPHRRQRLFILASHPDRVGPQKTDQRERGARKAQRRSEPLGLDRVGAAAHSDRFELRDEPERKPPRRLDVQGRGKAEPSNDGKAKPVPYADGGRLPAIREPDERAQQRARRDEPDRRDGQSYWRSVPMPQPTVCRVDDGLADGLDDDPLPPGWVDELRLTGNGVVPQQGALALRTLGEALGLCDDGLDCPARLGDRELMR